MKKNLIALLSIITIIAAGVSLMKSRPKGLGISSSPVLTKLAGPNWEPSGHLAQGDVLVSSKPPQGIYKRGQQDTQVGTILTDPLKLTEQKDLTLLDPVVWIQVRLTADHRWTRYDPLEAQMKGDKIVLKIPTSVQSGPHIENYVPSDFSSSIVKLEGLKGTYTVYLGDQRKGKITHPG